MSQPLLVRRLTRVERVKVKCLRRMPPRIEVGLRAQAVLFSRQGRRVHEIGDIVGRNRSTVFRWLLDDIEADRDHLYLSLDNGSIHHTRAVEAFLVDNRDRLTVIWNATYAPDLNLIERVWEPLKRSAIHNYYFGTVENLEKAVLDAVTRLHRNKNHPIRLPLKPVQSLPTAA